MAKNKSFIMYSHYYESISKLSYEEQGKLMAAIYEYNIFGKIKTELSVTLSFLFSCIKDQIEYDRGKYNAVIQESIEKKRVKEEKREEKRKRKRKEKEAKRKDKETGTLNKKEESLLLVKEENYVSVFDTVLDTPSNPIINNCLLGVCVSGAPEHVTHTREEMTEYFSEKGYNFLDRFLAFYESTNWAGVADWRSRADLWYLEDCKKTQTAQAPMPRYGDFNPQEAMERALERTNREFGGVT